MKKKLLSLALACGMVFSLAACTNDGAAPATNSPVANTESSAPESQTPSYETASVRVAYMPNMGSGSTLVTAQEMGYFEDYGLDVTLTQFQSGPTEIAAMASGDIDISQIGHGAHSLCIEGQAKIFAIDCLGVSFPASPQ